ncbi:hypothetical protein L6164_025162 [Bauhinia variegata]|uniref:Uncharacterized protein n=1 Tax=Bauhinia variegata TaxID=167791 RepID=A0ACB9LZH3_BAUVA|nr:hypothetical protein L6164_025162 [Bauhinia variegata]
MSTEALAMAGVDHMDDPIEIGALEQSFNHHPPPHLLANEYDEEDLSAHRDEILKCSLSLKVDEEWLKTKMREWAKAAASNNERKASLKAKEISLIMNYHRMLRK